MKDNNISPLFLYITSLIIYGSNGIFVSRISLGSEYLIFLRSLAGFLLLISICLILKKNLFKVLDHKKDLFYLAISGFSMAANGFLLFEAYRQISIALAILISYIGPVIVMLLSPIFIGNKLTVKELYIVILGFLGVCFIGGSGLTSNTVNMHGLILAALSALGFAFMILFNKKATNIKGIENATLQIFFCFIGMGIYLLFTGNYTFSISPNEIFPILWLCIINTGIGGLLYFSSIHKLSVSQVSFYGYLEPLSSVFFSFVILGEHLTLIQILGAILILAGPFLNNINLNSKNTLLLKKNN